MFGTLKKDISAVFKNDPAAKNIFEVLTYAGLHAVFWYRFAHFFYVRKARLFARLVSQSARFWTGIRGGWKPYTDRIRSRPPQD